ncbi:MAG: porphobilinogen synthase, partial [Planctomycetaceae bacterium]|nr:porphobilinogen synthase [Planctomycetaceae bacterium]
MKTRLRNLRSSLGIRKLVRETTLAPDDLVMPYFARPGKGQRVPIASMPGQFQLSIDELLKEARGLAKTGVGSVILFGIPSSKDPKGTGGYAKNGIVQQAVRALKDALPDLVVMT